MKSDFERALLAYEKGDLDESLIMAGSLLKGDENNCELLLLKAKIMYKQQKWGDALNVLNSILLIDSNHTAAINYKQMVMDILTFWHKDNYNP
jgi:predicted Zn-dependent protease